MENSSIIILFLSMVVVAGAAFWLILLIKTPYLEIENRKSFSFMFMLTCSFGIAGTALLSTLI